jgi:uncharacterized protein
MTRTLYRLLIGVVISVALAALFTVVLHTSDLALQLWDRFSNAPTDIITYVLTLTIALALFAWWVRRFWKRLRTGSSPANEPREPMTEPELQAALTKAESQGIDTLEANEELDDLADRRAHAKTYIGVYGEASTGKSALIKAFAKSADTYSDPRTGTTQAVTHYEWTAPSGTEVVLTDMPGLNAPGKELDILSQEEAQRAHMVLFVVDGDLTRTQYEQLTRLLQLDKPIVVVLNKADLLNAEEITLLQAQLQRRFGEAASKLELVTVSAGGTREVVRVYPNGREEVTVQTLPPKIESLVSRIDHHLVHGGELEPKRDAAVIALAQYKLHQATFEFRQSKADGIISSYTYKAMIGAMAAVSPGMDLIVQGYFGVAIVRDLCKLYDVPAASVEIDKFLKLIVKDLGKTLPLVLAATGNALKAFPGIGTLAGGVVHAIGYGLIFESLGAAVAKALEDRGRLSAGPILQIMEAGLGGNLETRARRLARLVITQARQKQ